MRREGPHLPSDPMPCLALTGAASAGAGAVQGAGPWYGVLRQRARVWRERGAEEGHQEDPWPPDHYNRLLPQGH